MEPKIEAVCDVVRSLLMPGHKKPLTRSAFCLSYLHRLDIKLVNAKGKPRAFHNMKAYVSSRDAEKIRQRFYDRHPKAMRRPSTTPA